MTADKETNRRERYAETADAYTVAAVIRKDLEAARDENARLRATIERVRELRKHGPVLTWDEIRAALEGDSA